jgi:uncharacterized SAM-binding protein YcdF (DUF218 family)
LLQGPRNAPLTMRARVIRLTGVIALAALVILLSTDIWLPVIGRWLSMPATPELRHADAIIVNGGTAMRTLYGIELYRQGQAPELWHTGYAKGEKYMTAIVERGVPQFSFRYLLKSIEPAVPSQAFHYLPTTSTWSDGTEIAATIRARKLRSVIIVTDWWHSRRALCATKQQLQGYDVVITFAPSPALVGPESWWQNEEMRANVESELVKLGYYAVRYGMTPWGC